MVSGLRTPKGLALAVLVKNWTNNSALIENLSKLGHCVSYKDTLAFENCVTKAILEKAVDIGMIIPFNISARGNGGGFIHCAADNIDFNEETCDGRNTTHATSAVLYQHGEGEHFYA